MRGLPFKSPVPQGLDPELLVSISRLIEETLNSMINGMSPEDALDTAIESRIRQDIKDIAMREIEKNVDNSMLRKLAEKAVDTGIDAAWDKVRTRITSLKKQGVQSGPAPSAVSMDPGAECFTPVPTGDFPTNETPSGMPIQERAGGPRDGPTGIQPTRVKEVERASNSPRPINTRQVHAPAKGKGNSDIPRDRRRRNHASGSSGSAAIAISVIALILGALGATAGIMATMSTGSTGPPGRDGLNGEQGPEGPEGPEGPQGLPGVQGESSIAQVLQTIKTTVFNHQKGNVRENISTPITIFISNGSRLHVGFAGVHWLNCTSADNWFTAEILINGTVRNYYMFRNQAIPTTMQDAITVSGYCSYLTATLVPGYYTVYATGRHDYIGTSVGAKTLSATLTVMEIVS